MSRVIVIVGSANLKATNIKKGVKIFNVTGTWTGWVDSTVTLYNRGSKFNNVSNMKYYGSKTGTPVIYPEFNTAAGIWCLQLWRMKSGSWWYGNLWLWFYDQIGKTPYIDTIEPWFWALKVSSTYDTVESWARGGSPLMIVEYPGTSKLSISEIQERYKSDTDDGSLQSGVPSFTGDYYSSTGYQNRMKVQWYIPDSVGEIPKEPGYSTKLSWRYTSDPDYTWIGQVKISCGWSLGVVSSKTYFDRIDYHPVK